MDEYGSETRPLKQETGQEVSSDNRLTPAGFNAIRGLNSPTEGTRPEPSKIHRIAPADEYVTDSLPLNAAAANDLELAAQKAMAAKATHYHNETRGSKIAEYRRLRSEITEDIACKNVKDGCRADSFSISGTNFPTYDVFGTQESSSVKAFTLKDGKPRYGAYRTHFAAIANPESPGNQKAALELMKLKQSDPDRWQELSRHLPTQVRQAQSTPQAAHALAETSTLRIPQDQVESVRKDLYSYIQTHPQKFSISKDTGRLERAAEARRLVDSKLLSIDDRFATAHYQAKAVELSNLRELNLRGRSHQIAA